MKYSPKHTNAIIKGLANKKPNPENNRNIIAPSNTKKNTIPGFANIINMINTRPKKPNIFLHRLVFFLLHISHYNVFLLYQVCI